MTNLNLKKWLNKITIFFIGISIDMPKAFASTVGSLPFTTGVSKLKDEIAGPFLLSVSVIMIVITCLMLAFGEWGDGFKKMIIFTFWLSVCFGVGSFLSIMFGGGAVF